MWKTKIKFTISLYPKETKAEERLLLIVGD